MTVFLFPIHLMDTAQEVITKYDSLSASGQVEATDESLGIHPHLIKVEKS